MAYDITNILEHFITHEFITLVDLVFWVGRLLGIYYSIKGVVAWWLIARSKSSSTMLAQLYGSPPTVANIFAVMCASSMMWNLGSGIMAFGQLIYGPISIDTSTPYSAVMFDAVTLNATNLVNHSISGSHKVTEAGRITIRACLAVFSMLGYFAYFKGVMTITKLGDPTVREKATLGGILLRCGLGAGLTLIDHAYTLLSTSITQAAAG